MTTSTDVRYVVLDGEITEVGDGDTINFMPNDLDRFKHLPEGKRPTLRYGAYPIRFQGIDTPELHISVDRPKELAEKLPHAKGAKLPKLPSPVHAQPMGDTAGDHLKRLTGFNEFGVQQKAGVILASGTDVYGRLIGYAFVAEDAEDLLGTMASTVDVGQVDDELLKQSLNFEMIKASMAYYTGYREMPAPHRDLFIQEAYAARKRGEGIWRLDPGWNSWLELRDEGSIGPESGRLILPKLYRRCISYLFSVNADDFTGNLLDWMRETAERAPDETPKPEGDGTPKPAADPVSDMVEINGKEYPFIDLIELGGTNNTDVRLKADPLTMVFYTNNTGKKPPRKPVLTSTELDP